MESTAEKKAIFHLPGLFEFFDFYKEFLPIFFEHRDFFYDWCEIGSIYGAPEGTLWGGGRIGSGVADSQKVKVLLEKYKISARLTFSNSLLKEEHLSDRKSNALCAVFEKSEIVQNGVIVHSDLLLQHLKINFPEFYFVSSTTKVLTKEKDFLAELNRPDFKFVVPDFRMNKKIDFLAGLNQVQKDKVEFLCNECCWEGCTERKRCYENVSRRTLGEECQEHKCSAPEACGGYVFSKAMKSPLFIGINDIKNVYLPLGFTNFKLEGRGLGNAILLEFLLYYLTKPYHQLEVRERLYLDSMLDLF